jgi:hypothetical protein
MSLSILCEVASPPGNPPPPEREQLPKGEKRPKNHLVASGQPKRQVDVEVLCAILCVAACQISKRTTTPVHREDRALDQYQPTQNGRPAKLTPSTGDGNRHDASGEEEPNCSVQELYPYQDLNLFRLDFHKKSQLRRFIDSVGNICEAHQKMCGQVDATWFCGPNPSTLLNLSEA